MIQSQRTFLIPAFAAAVILMVGVHARAAEPAQLPAGLTCEMARAKVAEHGRARALGWAIEQGYSWQQIRAAQRCLQSQLEKE